MSVTPWHGDSRDYLRIIVCRLENILLDAEFQLKLADFGLGAMVENADDVLFDRGGTPSYVAPGEYLALRYSVFDIVYILKSQSSL